jgi:hypothetical protein
VTPGKVKNQRDQTAARARLGRMNTAQSALLAIPVLLALAAPSLAADDPLVKILPPKDGASVCFERSYGAAHLKRHPKQQTTRILLSFRYQGSDGVHIERIALTRRGNARPLYFAGGCDWGERANRNSSGQRLLSYYPKDAGYACIALTAPGSAREGGFFLIDLARDGKSATLYFNSPIEAMQAADGRGFHGDVKLGRNDLVFWLKRTDASACGALEKTLPNLP